MRTIKASEIGTFLYCQRAWWFQQQGIESENISQLASGTEIHNEHGRTVMIAGCLRVTAYGLLLASLLLLVAHYTIQVL
ncbi:MAG: hypothetical protein FVQ83_06050 [Chloroflexi bacterium]|nr:hypothetical protein [Chloroflexota bacterium]